MDKDVQTHKPAKMSSLEKMLPLIKSIHSGYVFNRRVKVLSSILSVFIPDGSNVLDIGCGSGVISRLILQDKPGISIQGIDILVRPDCAIKCREFDGIHIPFIDSSVDLCMIVDVLHHTEHIMELLTEAGRVSRRYVLIKDHLAEGGLDHAVLKFMDWVGNRPHGIKLVYNYQSRKMWDGYFSSCNLKTVSWESNVPLYPFPFSSVFGRGLHFVALLEKK